VHTILQVVGPKHQHMLGLWEEFDPLSPARVEQERQIKI